MGKKKIETIVKEKIFPYSLNERGKSNLSQLIASYPYELLKECIDIGVTQYFRYDKQHKLIEESVNNFLNKLGGIAYNKSLPAINQEIKKIKNKCKEKFNYWNDAKANGILMNYVRALKQIDWSEKQIIEDLNTDVIDLYNSCSNWTQWCSKMNVWIKDIKSFVNENNDIEILHDESILPNALFNGLQKNFQLLCKQINASYEHNLYDCTSVMMRRFLESLLVIAYQKNDIESEITDKNGFHFSLDKIIKNAEQNKTLALSSTTKKEMSKFKELGNYSAHKIWFNTTKNDIEPYIFKYRTIIEELIYKAKLK